MSVDTRHVSRDSLFLFADLAFDGRGETARVKVRNLSSGGMMAEGGPAVSTGERLTIDLRNVGAIQGAVAWVQGNRYGVAFDGEIDPKLVRAPLATNADDGPRYGRVDGSAHGLGDHAVRRV